MVQAENPLLLGIVQRIISAHHVAFHVRADKFLITSRENTAKVVAVLTKELNDVEQQDIRVADTYQPDLFSSLTLQEWNGRSKTDWFDAALVNDHFTTYFQPIVQTASNAVFGHECLIRLSADRLYNGAEIIDAAKSRGSIHVFDSYARRLNIRHAGLQHRRQSKVFVNFMPSSIYDPKHCMRSTMAELQKTHLRSNDVVFEIVESDLLSNSKHLRKICDFYREENFGFALDDVGTGSNSLQLMCDLHPEYIKLDKSLTAHLESPMYRATVETIVELATKFNIHVIAEGIENTEMRDRASALGIKLMQGYFFGRPSPQMHPSSVSDLVCLSSVVQREQRSITVH